MPNLQVYVQLPAALLASKHLYRVSPCATFDTLGANFLSSGSRIPHSSPTSQSEVGPPDGLSGIHITGSLTRKPSLPAIITLRVHAIYSCNRKILYILLTLLCAELITEIILIVFISDRFTGTCLRPLLDLYLPVYALVPNTASTDRSCVPHQSFIFLQFSQAVRPPISFPMHGHTGYP